MKKRVVLFAAILLLSMFTRNCYIQSNLDQPINKIDLDAQKESFIQTVLPYSKVNSSAVFQQRGQTYLLYQLEPTSNEAGTPILLQYGYLHLKQDFDQYRVVDQQTFSYDGNMDLDLTGSSMGNLYYGVILNPEINRIEIYANNLLVATYIRSSLHDFYFIALPFQCAEIQQEIYYDSGNRVIRKIGI